MKKEEENCIKKFSNVLIQTIKRRKLFEIKKMQLQRRNEDFPNGPNLPKQTSLSNVDGPGASFSQSFTVAS